MRRSLITNRAPNMAKVAMRPATNGPERGTHHGEVNQLTTNAGMTVITTVRAISPASSIDPFTCPIA